MTTSSIYITKEIRNGRNITLQFSIDHSDIRAENCMIFNVEIEIVSFESRNYRIICLSNQNHVIPLNKEFTNIFLYDNSDTGKETRDIIDVLKYTYCYKEIIANKVDRMLNGKTF
jgi:hypothetical protein